MQPSVQLVAGVVGIVALVIVFLVWRRNAVRSSRANGRSYRGPTDMHFTCAGCSGRFAHTRRTVAAWEKGSRRVFCDACHKQWRNAQPPQVAPQVAPPRPAIASSHQSAGARSVPAQAARAHHTIHPSESKAPGGCLGMVLLVSFIPVAIFALATLA